MFTMTERAEVKDKYLHPLINDLLREMLLLIGFLSVLHKSCTVTEIIVGTPILLVGNQDCIVLFFVLIMFPHGSRKQQEESTKQK